MKFTKMHGCGNDYIYVNGFEEKIEADKKPEVVKKLSDRHFGIGGDGLIFINPSDVADFEMEMYNADGSRAEMCGNGIRCVAKYVYDKGLTDKKEISIVSAGKIKYISLTINDTNSSGKRGEVSSVRVNMGSPELKPELIPVKYDGDTAINIPIKVKGTEYKMTCVSMGNPHAVIFMDGVSEMKIEDIGPEFENHEMFPRRTNTEFAEILDRKNIRMRVWERGTGETLACGTGCCATTVAAVLRGLVDEDVTIHVLGGDIQVCWDRKDNLIYMTGPATIVFEGEVDI